MSLVRSASLLLLLLSLVVSSAVGAEADSRARPKPARARQAHPAQYLVFEIDERGNIRHTFQREVTLARPPRSLSQAELERRQRRERPGRGAVRVQLHGPRGEVAFRDLQEVPTWIRGEFHGAAGAHGGSEIESHAFADPRSRFVVRVPAGKGRTLVLEGETRGTIDVFDLEAPAAAQPAPEGQAQGVLLSSAAATGDPANRLDLLVMGDGYTAGEAQLFASDAERFESSFFGITPYLEYKSHVNVHTLFVPSAQSGADHPPYHSACSAGNPNCCADPAAQSDPRAGTWADTAFGARYCANNIHRLLVVDTQAVLAAASAVPDWDQIVVLVNDPSYGGAGYGAGLPLAVASTNSYASDLVRHEVGHSLSQLADEYENPYPGYPPCSDVGGSTPCQPNVTDQTSPSRVKWLPWIAPQTPIPTPESGSYASVVGLFEGARYQASGMYRPHQSECLMRYLGKPFCPVCRQAFVLALYGGWGGAGAGIDPIEPGSETPPPGEVATSLCGMVLSADLLEPAAGPGLAVTWLVDDVPVPGAEGSRFGFVPPAPGSYEVTLRVEDVTPLVAAELASELVSTRSWQVEVAPEDCPFACADGFDNDGDGLVDGADRGCTGPSDDDERNPRGGCGIGPELAGCVLALWWARRRRAGGRGRS